MVTIWFFVDRGVSGASVSWLIFLETIVLGVLMFSAIRYYSFKEWPRREKVPIAWIFLLVLVFVFLAVDPPMIMMVLGVTYVVSGVLITLLGRRNRQLRRLRRAARRTGRAAEKPSGDEGDS